jgi:hypothetical protein
MGVTSSGAAVLGSTPPGAAASFGTTLADGDLPSVMTCANYLKLPPYSCKVSCPPSLFTFVICTRVDLLCICRTCVFGITELAQDTVFLRAGGHAEQVDVCHMGRTRIV